jgi:hypothetical protein
VGARDGARDGARAERGGEEDEGVVRRHGEARRVRVRLRHGQRRLRGGYDLGAARGGAGPRGGAEAPRVHSEHHARAHDGVGDGAQLSVGQAHAIAHPPRLDIALDEQVHPLALAGPRGVGDIGGGINRMDTAAGGGGVGLVAPALDPAQGLEHCDAGAVLAQLAANVGMVEGKVILLREKIWGIVKKVCSFFLVSGFKEDIHLIMPLHWICWKLLSQASWLTRFVLRK